MKRATLLVGLPPGITARMPRAARNCDGGGTAELRKVAHPMCGAPRVCELSQAEADEVALPLHSRRFVTYAARWARPSNSFSVVSSASGSTRSMRRHEGAGSIARSDFVSVFAVSWEIIGKAMKQLSSAKCPPWQDCEPG
jgi:hypothetical protein